MNIISSLHGYTISCHGTMMTKYLFDFTTTESVDNWYEVSDTVRSVGKSKATLVLQKTREFQRGIFFVLLNPQPNGACFAGMNYDSPFDFSGYSGLEIRLRSQASNITHWKIVLKTSASIDRFTSYEQIFELKNEVEFKSVTLMFNNFHQMKNGEINPDEVPLQKNDVKTFGFQAFGGVYEDEYKQNGPGTLEIDSVKLV